MTSSTTMTTTATYTRSTTATNTRSTMLLHVFLVLFLYTNFHYPNNDAKHKIFVIHGLSFSSYTTTCTCTSSCYNHNKYANTNFYQSIDSKLHIRTNHNPSEVRERKRMRRLEYEQRVQEDAEAALIDGTLVVELDDENRPLSIIYKSDPAGTMRAAVYTQGLVCSPRMAAACLCLSPLSVSAAGPATSVESKCGAAGPLRPPTVPLTAGRRPSLGCCRRASRSTIL